MEGKKKYIAIILFLLICLMVFTFATTGEEELEEGNGSNIQEVTDNGSTDSEEKDSETEEIIEEEVEANTNSNESSSNQNTTNETSNPEEEDLEGTGNTDNSAYDKALEAVKELENLLTDAQADIARDLVEEVTNSDQYKELMDRVEDAEDAIDAAKLVEELEQMVKDAAKKADITEAKDFRDEDVTDAINEIDGTNLAEVKSELEKRIEELSKILDDENNPKIEGIEDGEFTNKDEVSLTITDENEVTTTVTKDGQKIDITEKFTEEGTYEVKVVDAAFNEVTKTFTIDRTAPTYKFYKVGSSLDKDEIKPTEKNGKLYFTQNVRVRFIDNTQFSQFIHNDFINNEDRPNITTWSRETKADGKHTMKVTDAAGNTTEVTFYVDTTAPTFEFYKVGSSLDKDKLQPIVKNGKLYFTENVRVRFTDNVEFSQYIHNDFVNNENRPDISTWTRETKADGKHTMKVTDAVGNATEITFYVDTTAPTYKFYKEGSSLDKDEINPTIIDGKLYFNQNVRVRFTDNVEFSQYIHNDFVNNENRPDISIWTREAKTEGQHTMKVTDALGHATEVTFYIDKTPNRVTQTFFRGDIKTGNTFLIKNGSKIQFNIGFSELLGEEAKVTIGGKEVKLTYEKYFESTKSHMYYGYLEIAEDEEALVEGELEIVISNITDQAGNKGFYYQTNGKKLYETYSNVLTTNLHKVKYDRTSNVVTQTFFRGETKKGNTFFIKNGSKIQFNIGFSELLSEEAKVTIGGKEVKLTYEKYFESTKSHMYYGYLEIAEDEAELVEGELEIAISNITDQVGNKGFYYQTNGKKLYETYSNVLTTNLHKVFYDVTAPEVTPSYTETTTEQDEDFNNYPTFEIVDNSGDTVTKELLSGSVDTTKLGTYKLTYRFTDVVGNYTDVTVKVKVIDTKAPTISGITDGAYYNTKDTHAIPSAYDKNGAIMFIRTELGDLQLTSFLKNEKEIKIVGTYKVWAVDSFGNKSEEITIHIDPYAPKVLVLDRIENISGALIPIKPVILEHNLDTIEVTLDGKKIDYKNGDQLTKDGKYVMTVTDKAKNSTTVEFTMDSIAPTMIVSPLTLGVVDELDLNKVNSITGDLIISEDAEYQLMKVKKYITVLDKSIPIYEYAELPEDKIIDEEGEYILIAYDKAYNVTAAKFIVDRTAPVIKGVEDGKTYNTPVTITVEEANPIPIIGTNLSKKSAIGKYLPTTFPEDGIISENGEYSIEATDIAGNKSTTIKFTVDTLPPLINIDIKEEILQSTEPVKVVATVTDNISATKSLSPNVTKIVAGEETDLGVQDTIDASVNGVTYRLEYTTTDDAGNPAEKVIKTIKIVNITYEVRFNKTSYSSTYNGTTQTIPEDATFYMIKDGVESVVEDAVITYSSSAPLLNAGKYTITASANGYKSAPVEFTMNKATIKVDFTSLPSKLAVGSTKTGLINNTSITGSYEEENIIDYKLYQIGNPTNEIETVEQTTYCLGATYKGKCLGLTSKYFYSYVLFVKKEYENNYEIADAINIDLTDYKIDLRISGVVKYLNAE